MEIIVINCKASISLFHQLRSPQLDKKPTPSLSSDRYDMLQGAYNYLDIDDGHLGPCRTSTAIALFKLPCGHIGRIDINAQTSVARPKEGRHETRPDA